MDINPWVKWFVNHLEWAIVAALVGPISWFAYCEWQKGTPILPGKKSHLSSEYSTSSHGIADPLDYGHSVKKNQASGAIPGSERDRLDGFVDISPATE